MDLKSSLTLAHQGHVVLEKMSTLLASINSSTYFSIDFSSPFTGGIVVVFLFSWFFLFDDEDPIEQLVKYLDEVVGVFDVVVVVVVVGFKLVTLDNKERKKSCSFE